MGYQLDLDEMSSESLLEELHRRKADHAKGLCDYCHRPVGVKPSCKFPERHDPPAHPTVKLMCTHYQTGSGKTCSKCTRKGCAACDLCENC